MSEELFEIIIKDLRLVGEDRQRSVDTHRTGYFLSFFGHGCQNLVQIFHRVAEHAFALQQRFGVAAGRFFRRQAGEIDEVFAEPFFIGLAGGDFVFDFFIRHDAAFFHIDEEHAARFEAAFAFHVGRIDIYNTGFGTHNDVAVFGNDVARRAQAVAVENGTETCAVSEWNGSGAVPRLHQAGVVFVECFFLGTHGLMVLPGFGNEHAHDVRE